MTDHIVDASEMVAGYGLVCLPKLHVAYLTGFAKISGLYISDLKIKDLSIPYRHQQADDHVKRIAVFINV